MATELCIIGILNPWTNHSNVAWAQAILTLVWTATFQLSAGQLGWALPAEIGSTRLRQKTVCLARNVSNISGTVGGTLENYFMNPEAWNLQGYTGFVWGGQYNYESYSSSETNRQQAVPGSFLSGRTSDCQRPRIAPSTN